MKHLLYLVREFVMISMKIMKIKYLLVLQADLIEEEGLEVVEVVVHTNDPISKEVTVVTLRDRGNRLSLVAFT